jgi:sterol desaturase/sphingolipid hydroxylase (fatty acid hydroxylase superfamily)
MKAEGNQLVMFLLSIFEIQITIFGTVWEYVKSFHLSTFLTTFIVVAVIPTIFFYLYGLLLFGVDMFTSKSFKAKYKVQPDIEITNKQYFDALRVSIFNWLCLGFPYLAAICYLVIPYLCGATPGSDEYELPPIPTIGVFFRDLVVYILVEEVMFYYSHRLLHQPKLYGPIHKFHHKFTAPFGIAAIYAHPIEHMLSNVIPVSVGTLLMRSHPTSAMAWGVLALFNTMTVHSGYDFSHLLLFPAPYFHDWHHEKFNENYGAIQLLDYLHNTNKSFVQMMRTRKFPMSKHD